MLTLTRTREAVATLLRVRSEIRTLTDQADVLTADLRPALSHWGPVAADSVTLYVAAASERRTLDADKITTLALSLGATREQVEACYKITTTAAPVKSRARKATDR